MSFEVGRRPVLRLLGLGCLGLLAGCSSGKVSSAGPSTAASPTPKASMLKISYGADASQYGDLYLPAGDAATLPVAVVVHGGYWGPSYGNDLGAPLAADLAAHGIAAWNIEYRRIGIGGGWPTTFTDVADAMDVLAGKVTAAADDRLDLGNVVAVGHSAGGQIAAWLAARHKLPMGQVGASPKVTPVGYVAQAGVLDLVSGFDKQLGGGAVGRLMGGSPTKYPERYAVGSPYALLPFGVPATLVHGLDDEIVPIAQSDSFAARAKQLGDAVTEIRMPGVEHFGLIDPTTRAWAACRSAAMGYLRVV